MKNEVSNTFASLCAALTDLGCAYEIEMDNRGGNRSGYIFVRKPIAAKIRVSDHASTRNEARSKLPIYDVRVGDSLSYDKALAAIRAAV